MLVGLWSLYYDIDCTHMFMLLFFCVLDFLYIRIHVLDVSSDGVYCVFVSRRSSTTHISFACH